MATIVSYTGDGSTVQYAITFAYIERSDVVVEVDGSAATFSFVNDTTIEFSSAPANGAEITIKRSTPLTPLVDFTDGSTLFEADLDLAHTQSRNISEEARDIANDAKTTVDANIDDILTVAGISTDVSDVAAIDTDVTTVSNVSTKVTTVADNIADVNIVADSIASVLTVAQDLNEAISEIETVANDLNEATSDIEIVSSNISDVNALGPVATYMPSLASISSQIANVGNNTTNVTTVGQNISNVNAVASNSFNINRVSVIQSDVITVSGINADISTLAPRNTDIATLADIENGTNATNAIQTTAGISSAITTVSGINSDVSTVSGISTDVSTVAGNNINVSTVATNIASVNSVAGISTDVTGVANVAADVTAVASIGSDVTTVAGISANVSTVAADSTVINTVANAITDVSTVSTDIASVITAANDLNEAVSEIETVANAITNVDTVGTNIANVNTVAGISSDVTTVANDGTDIGTVATDITNVNTVAGISANVTTVAGISSDVTTVAADAADIGTVATDIANVNAVGGSISNVNTVATNITNFNDFFDVYRVGATDPTTSLDTGDLFYNTTSGTLKVYTGSAWEQGVTAGSGFLPLSGGGMTGDITFSGTQTVDGRDLSVDGAKLDGIEAGATADQTKADIDALGINAATLDSLDSTQFLRSDANDSGTGSITLTTGANVPMTLVSNDFGEQLIVKRNDANASAGIKFQNNSGSQGTFFLDHTGPKWNNGSASYKVWHETNDGAGSGLDADLWDGNQFSAYLNQSVKTTDNPTFNNLYLNEYIIHSGDTDTYLQFGTNTITLSTGGSNEITVNTTGVRLGDTGNGYFRPVSGAYGSIEIDGGAHSTWEGYSIGGRAVFMHDNGGGTGIFNDVNDEWLFYGAHNAETRMYYNGVNKFQTTTGGAQVNGDLTVSGGDIVLSGTGRIQGIDTVSSGTDAASKTYVDNAIAAAPSGIAQNETQESVILGTNATYVSSSAADLGRGQNVFIGYNAANNLYSSAHERNVIIGWNTCEYANSAGLYDYNVIIGAAAGHKCLSGGLVGDLTVVGYAAEGRGGDTCLGYQAGGMSSSTAPTEGTGRNVCIGYRAGKQLDRYHNVIIGYEAAGGVFAPTHKDRIKSTAIGPEAGSSRWHVNNCVELGSVARASSSTASNEITLGNSSITSLRCNTTSISSLSDARDKTNVEDIQWGLDFINDLRPVSFTWDSRDGEKVGGLEIGFIAQEVAQVEQDRASEPYTKMVNWENPEALELAPHKAFPILVKAVQELSAQVEALEARLAALEGE